MIMSEGLATTRRTLHGIAEHILTAHQWRVAGTIRLSLWPGGFCTQPLPGTPAVLGVRGTHLVVGTTSDLVPISGTFGDLAERAGVTFGLADAPYPPASGCARDDQAIVDAAAAAELADAWWAGQSAMLALTAENRTDTRPVLWPEHFDLGVTLDQVNYGLSPGDQHIPLPYAYVGPWTPRVGPFWTHTFGAARTVRDLGSDAAIVDFFREGRRRAATDPVAG